VVLILTRFSVKVCTPGIEAIAKFTRRGIACDRTISLVLSLQVQKDLEIPVVTYEGSLHDLRHVDLEIGKSVL
jgi:hypothetical protein